MTAQEEFWNFDMAHQHIHDIVWILGSERKDEHVRDLNLNINLFEFLL